MQIRKCEITFEMFTKFNNIKSIHSSRHLNFKNNTINYVKLGTCEYRQEDNIQNWKIVFLEWIDYGHPLIHVF